MLGVEASKQLAQAASAAALGVEHRQQVLPAVKAFDVPVSLVLLGQALEASARDGFDELLNPAYAEHVAALAEIELALRGIASYANSRNNLFKLSLPFPGQQWAKAGIHVSPHTPSGFRLAPE